MPDFSIVSLRGGMNNTDPSISLPEDQCTSAVNVEWINSMLGERRLGTIALATLPTFSASALQTMFLTRHLPTADESAAELWTLMIESPLTPHLGRKTTAWSEITISDTPTMTAPYRHRWQAVSVHGKLFFAYKSDQDRLHVWDGTSMRRVGLKKTTTAPTAADSGGGGTLATKRYGRVRFVEKSGTTVLRRSEPSDALGFTPDGAHVSITWTRPTAPGEGETHWEIELSPDNANFYVVSSIVLATTTYVDSAAVTAYAQSTLSETITGYDLIPSARYLAVDDDRLIWAGSWESDAYGSRVGWTPVYGATGAGNDERFQTFNTPFKDLDTSAHGAITGLTGAVLGGVWVFKNQAIYKLTRTGNAANAYDADRVSEQLGAIHGSVQVGVDEQGRSCVYFIDRGAGPCRIGVEGIARCGDDIRKTWQSLNVDSTAVAVCSLYYPFKRQMIWNIATRDTTKSDTTPTVRIVLHVDKSRTFQDGVRKGWSIWTGDIATAQAMCLFSQNIDSNTTRDSTLIPFQANSAGTGNIYRCDVGSDGVVTQYHSDNGTAYAASIVSKPYGFGTMLDTVTVDGGGIVATASATASLKVKVWRDFQAELTNTTDDITFVPDASETAVTVKLDDVTGAEISVAQFELLDVTSPVAQWQVHQFAARYSKGQGI